MAPWGGQNLATTIYAGKCLSQVGENTGTKSAKSIIPQKGYSLTIWGDQDIKCAICGKFKAHGIGIEGPGEIDVDVCDDCAGFQVMVGLEATDRARAHIAQAEMLHAKIHGLIKKKSPRHEIMCRTCKTKQERLKKRRGVTR